MMTGVETAGLVLAVIPRLISAFEHYNGNARGTQEVFEQEKYIRRAI